MPTEMRIGGMPILSMADPFDADTPLNILLWGKPGCGKTLLASTACAPILFVQFDPGGYLSLRDRPNVFVWDMSQQEPTACVDVMALGDSSQVYNFIKQHGIRTLVFDSLTTYYWLALRYVVAKLATKNNSISIETPSQAGYAQRNSVMHQSLTSFMGLTMKLRLDTILLLHEGTPITKTVPVPGQTGRTMEVTGDITPSITMNALNLIGVRVSEIWHMTQIDEGHRRIELRPCRGYTPMKTRMFATHGEECEFNVPIIEPTQEGVGIASWTDAWRKGGGRKLALPK